MLLNDFFHITNSNFDADNPTVAVRLNPNHEIYKAHFPEQPITPGVCQIQMVTEILSLYLNAEVRLTDIKNIKYMTVISPTETRDLTIRFLKTPDGEDMCKVGVVFEKDERVFSKMSMIYHVVRNHSDIQ